jgi:hypothetical protein
VNSDRLFSPDSSTNKTDCLDITELLLKVVLNTIKLTLIIAITMWYNFQQQILTHNFHSLWLYRILKLKGVTTTAQKCNCTQDLKYKTFT